MNRDCFKYYGDVLHCISVNETLHIKIDNIDIDLINNNTSRNITFYVLKEHEKKLSMPVVIRNLLLIMIYILMQIF